MNVSSPVLQPITNVIFIYSKEICLPCVVDAGRQNSKMKTRYSPFILSILCYIDMCILRNRCKSKWYLCYVSDTCTCAVLIVINLLIFSGWVGIQMATSLSEGVPWLIGDARMLNNIAIYLRCCLILFGGLPSMTIANYYFQSSAASEIKLVNWKYRRGQKV